MCRLVSPAIMLSCTFMNWYSLWATRLKLTPVTLTMCPKPNFQIGGAGKQGKEQFRFYYYSSFHFYVEMQQSTI